MIQSNKYLRLEIPIDLGRLTEDLNTCSTFLWSSHFNTSDYSGKWTSIALKSMSGLADDIRSEPGATYKGTEALEKCNYVTELLARLPFGNESVRFLNLAARSEIKTHRDLGMAYRFGCFRLHIPVLTSNDIEMKVDGVQVDMKAGECWYADFDLPHSVYNPGTSERVHLVIDGVRNAWSDEWFREAGYDFAAEKKALLPDEITLRRTIAELERVQTEASKKLIEELKQQLNEG